MTQVIRRGVSVWNNKQGWTCEKLPTISEGEIAVIIQMKNGLSEGEVKKKLESEGFEFRVCHIGKNDPKLAKETKLVYLVEVCNSYDKLLETISALQALEIPVSAISVIDSQLF